MLRGLGLSRGADPMVKDYFEECLSKAEDGALKAVKQ